MPEHIISVVTMDKLNARRRTLIETLRAGTYKQGWKNLLSQRIDYEHTNNGYPSVTAVPNSQRLCCLGVGMAIADDSWLARGISSKCAEYDLAPDYEKVCTYYNISPKLMNYLMGMNDGDMVCHPEKTIEVNSTVYQMKKIIRQDAPGRNFKFVARYLEIVWGLK